MTNEEIQLALVKASNLVNDVYYWANQPHTKYTGMRMSDEIARLMSSVDTCIHEAMDVLDRQ